MEPLGYVGEAEAHPRGIHFIKAAEEYPALKVCEGSLFGHGRTVAEDFQDLCRQVRSRFVITAADAEWGGCPECLGHDGYLNIGPRH